MSKTVIRLALAAASAFFLASAAPAFAGDCANCPNCPKKAAATADSSTAQAAPAPGDKKPEGEKPKCECAKGGECLCAKAGKPCSCGKPAPKA